MFRLSILDYYGSVLESFVMEDLADIKDNLSKIGTGKMVIEWES